MLPINHNYLNDEMVYFSFCGLVKGLLEPTNATWPKSMMSLISTPVSDIYSVEIFYT